MQTDILNAWPDKLNAGQIVLEKMAPIPQNAQKLFNLVKNNKIHLQKVFPQFVTDTSSIQGTMNYLNILQKEDIYGYFDGYGVFLKDKLIGAVNICGRRMGKREIMYWLSEDFCGYGYANEILRAVELCHANFSPLQPLFAEVAKDNLSSIHLLKRRGYQAESEMDGYVIFSKIPLASRYRYRVCCQSDYRAVISKQQLIR